MQQTPAEMVLAFDIGLQRTGVASGQTLTQTAAPAGVLNMTNGRCDWSELDKLLRVWQPQTLIIGDPKTEDPHLNKAINRFKSYIQQHYKLPIIEIDEAFTSVAANAKLHSQTPSLSTDKKIQLRDQIAASLILESYFNSLN